MPKKSIKIISEILHILIGIFVLLIAFLFAPMQDEIRRMLFPVAGVLGLLFMILGVALIILTVKRKVKGKLKIFLLLAGASSAAILPSAILHNLVYALLIFLFGEGFLGAGWDEPFFFLLAVIVAPIVFLVGAIGSCVLLKNKK